MVLYTYLSCLFEENIHNQAKRPWVPSQRYLSKHLFGSILKLFLVDSLIFVHENPFWIFAKYVCFVPSQNRTKQLAFNLANISKFKEG